VSSDKALEALEGREYERALSLLKRELAVGSEGEPHALAGLACFQLEDYAAAVQHYTAALQADGQRDDWREMLAVAQANDTARVNVHVPALHYFDRGALLAPASVREGALPAPLPAQRAQTELALHRGFRGRSRQSLRATDGHRADAPLRRHPARGRGGRQ
jgi:tetratricopeptide (TPR) repeat protein